MAPVLEDVHLVFLRARLHVEDERIRLDDQQRIGFVPRNFDIRSFCVFSFVEVETPGDATTTQEQHVISQVLSLTCALTKAEE